MTKKFLPLFFLCGFIVSIFGGCALFDEDAVGAITMPEAIDEATEDAAEGAIVDVYWDATYSMRGYTTLAAGNVYRTLPDLLGDIGDSMGEVHFFRFGENVTPLSGREHRKFSEPGFYDELVTAVHNAVDTANADHLSIIVTDLFESDADWSNVTKKLKDKYFAKHNAVAVIGIKNSFNGDIFDVGLNAAKFSYDSGDNPERFRPFYLIVMGSDGKVKNFLAKWKERQTMPNETGYLLLSENLIDGAGDFSALKIKSSENLYADERLGIKDKRMKEFGVDSFADPVSLTVSFAYRPTLGACPLDMNALKTSVKIFSLEDETWQRTEQDGDAKVTVAPSGDAADDYDVTLTFTPETNLAADRINFVAAAVTPDAKGYRLPDWVRAWNMANVDVSPSDFDGAKTTNLLRVIESLKDSALSAAQPSLVKINLVIDK